MKLMSGRKRGDPSTSEQTRDKQNEKNLIEFMKKTSAYRCTEHPDAQKHTHTSRTVSPSIHISDLKLDVYKLND